MDPDTPTDKKSSSVVSEQTYALPQDLHRKLRHRQKSKDRSNVTSINLHFPLLRECIASAALLPTRTNPNVILLGDGVLSKLPPELRSSTVARPTLQPSHRPSAHMKVIDVTVPGDTIRNVLYRLDLGLFSLLAQLFATSSTAPNIIILHVGAHDLPSKTSTSTSIYTRSLISAFTTLLSVLLHTHPTTHVLVVGLLPRRDNPAHIIRHASTELEHAVRARAGDAQHRLHFIMSPLSLTSGHLDSRVALNTAGCRILAGVLQSTIDETLSARDSTTPTTPSVPAWPSNTATEDEEIRSSPYAPLRPAQDVLSRIVHDTENYDASRIVIGYEDRHEGIKEISASEWQRDSTDEVWVPMHRVRYFKRQGGDEGEDEGELLWDRTTRVDKVFGR